MQSARFSATLVLHVNILIATQTVISVSIGLDMYYLLNGAPYRSFRIVFTRNCGTCLQVLIAAALELISFTVYDVACCFLTYFYQLHCQAEKQTMKSPNFWIMVLMQTRFWRKNPTNDYCN